MTTVGFSYFLCCTTHADSSRHLRFRSHPNPEVRISRQERNARQLTVQSIAFLRVVKFSQGRHNRLEPHPASTFVLMAQKTYPVLCQYPKYVAWYNGTDQRVKEIKRTERTWYSMSFSACSLSSSLDSLKNLEEQMCRTTSLQRNKKMAMPCFIYRWVTKLGERRGLTWQIL